MWEDMIFSQSADDPCRILVPATIAKELDQYRQRELLQHEAGGVLLGLRRGPHIEVVKITTPNDSWPRLSRTKRKSIC